MTTNNIFNYIHFKGDLDFSISPLNNIDLLIFTVLIYAPIIEFEECKIKDIQCSNVEYSASEDGYQILNMMKRSSRYKDLTVKNFKEYKTGQYKALAVFEIVAGDKHIVVFRGSDDGLETWKDNFKMSYDEAIFQKYSYQYLNDYMDINYKYILAGHSKGGNAALYGAMKCNDELKENIERILSFDGPGINEYFKNESYLSIEEKLEKYVPEYSIVGQLLDNSKNHYIVSSNASGIGQHDPCTWDMDSSDFIYIDQMSYQSIELSKMFNHWLEQTSLHQRQAIVDDVFNAFKESGHTKLSQLHKGNSEGIEHIIYSILTCQKESKNAFKILIKMTLKKIKKINIYTFIENKTYVLFLIIGLFFLWMPSISMRFLGMIFFLSLLFYSLKKATSLYILENLNHEQRLKRNLYTFISLTGFICILIQKVLITSTSIILALMFLYLLYNQYKNKKKLQMFVSFIMLVVSLALGNDLQSLFMIASGSYLILNSIYEIIEMQTLNTIDII